MQNIEINSTGSEIPDAIEEAIQHLFIQKKWTLSIAESCTGGRIASKLTSLPGSSSYFLGAIVAYSNFLKQQVLGVSKELIETRGAVSEETVIAMANGVMEISGSTFSAAISGIAGPSGGTPQKPVGTVWAAVIRKGKFPQAWRFQAIGSREMILNYSCNAVLIGILNYAQSNSI